MNSCPTDLTRPHERRPVPLDRVRMFRGLAPADRSRLERALTMRDYRRGSRIYAAGDPADAVFGVAQGVVKLSTRSRAGRALILAFAGPGQIFGELAVEDGGARDHEADAHEDAVVIAIAHEALTALIRETAELGWQFNRALATRMKSLRTRVEELLSTGAEARLALALSALADAHGIADADGVLIPLRLSQRDMAALAGLSRETVNGVIRGFRERQLVETVGGHFRIRRPDGLRAIR